jgi:hypothetical protein
MISPCGSESAGGPDERLAELVRITGIDRPIKVVDSVADALDAR